MSPKILARIIRAAGLCTTKAKGERFAHVYAATAHRIEATDGHRMIRIDTVDAHGLTAGRYYAPADAVKRLAADTDPRPVTLDDRWPDTDQVQPRKADGDGPCEALTVDPRSLATTAEAVALALGIPATVKGAHVPHVEVRFFDSLAPARISGTFDGVTVTALLMPVRA